MLKEGTPYQRHPTTENADYKIQFPFHFKKDVNVAFIFLEEDPIFLEEGPDFTIVKKFGTPYVRLHYNVTRFHQEPLPENGMLLIYRQVPVRQRLPIPTSRTEPRPNLERQLDRIVMMIQELFAPSDGVVRFPPEDPAEKELIDAESRAQYALGFDGSINAELAYKPTPLNPTAPTDYQHAGLTTTTKEEYKAYHGVIGGEEEGIIRMQYAMENLTDVTVLDIYEDFPALPVGTYAMKIGDDGGAFFIGYMDEAGQDFGELDPPNYRWQKINRITVSDDGSLYYLTIRGIFHENLDTITLEIGTFSFVLSRTSEMFYGINTEDAVFKDWMIAEIGNTHILTLTPGGDPPEPPEGDLFVMNVGEFSVFRGVYYAFAGTILPATIWGGNIDIFAYDSDLRNVSIQVQGEHAESNLVSINIAGVRSVHTDYSFGAGVSTWVFGTIEDDPFGPSGFDQDIYIESAP